MNMQATLSRMVLPHMRNPIIVGDHGRSLRQLLKQIDFQCKGPFHQFSASLFVFLIGLTNDDFNAKFTWGLRIRSVGAPTKCCR